jgi:hypothetical protein
MQPPQEIRFTARHEGVQRQRFRQTAAARLQDGNKIGAALRLFRHFDLPDALTGIAAILLEHARAG